MDEISIVLTGEAGKGLQTVEEMVTKILAQDGYNIYASKEIMSRVRGGNNTTQIRVSNTYAGSYVKKTDFLFVFNPNALYRLEDRIQKETVVIGPKSFFKDEDFGKYNIKETEFLRLASEIGNPIYSNTIVMGMILGMLNATKEHVYKALNEKFSRKGEKLVQENIAAFEKGYSLGEVYKLDIQRGKPQKHISGNEAVTYGAVAGGMNFVAAYPMSPGTDVVMLSAKWEKEFDIIVEQAEDEIAAVNMVLGAWYAGARALTSTSGGGFALMEEAISMSGVGELPLVIHNAMRPGPGTGLPTRTEQGDLNLAMYAGHGDFPRVLLAPTSLESGVELAQKAFNIADKYQVPVIILSDSHYLSQSLNLGEVNLEENEYHVIESTEDYKRYQYTDSGISPRSVPGYGEGLVKVDSDEHTEEGLITEDFDVRIKMMDKRMKKLDKYTDIEPELIGSPDYETLIVGWGSTYGAIKEALQKSGNEKVSFLSFKQVFPLPKSTKSYLDKAKKLILIENNAVGHFGDLIKLKTGAEFHKKVLKYNGLPFNIEELIQEIGEY
jgi:2-oxoglutarate ferredoxin oxidoreductase subunit alpha